MDNFGMPGIGTETVSAYRKVFATEAGSVYLPAGKTIDGSKSRDPSNTGYIDVLQPGTLMGKISASGKYAPSIIGLTAEALDGDETALDIPASAVIELTRRVGATGTFKITGPATAGGTVRTLTATYSGFADADTVAIGALGVKSVWTATNTADADAGTFALEITTNLGTATSAAVAFDVTAANFTTALVAMTNIGADGVTVTGANGGPYTLTFKEYLGNATVRVVNDATVDSPIYEGGVVLAQTAVGVDGRFVTGSLIQPTDGSETIRTFLPDGSGLKVTDVNGTSIDKAFSKFPIGGVVTATQFINYPADAATRLWIQDALNTYGIGFSFVDNF